MTQDKQHAGKKATRRAVQAGACEIALDQARAFVAQARAAHAEFGEVPTVGGSASETGARIAATVTVALGLELYLKAYMIAARQGRVSPEHDLIKLYAEFPRPFKDAIERRFAEVAPPDGWLFPVIGVQLADASDQAPDVPDDSARPRDLPEGATFVGWLRGLASVFTRERYFYERVVAGEWAMFAYLVAPGLAMAEVLDSVLADYRAGKLVP